MLPAPASSSINESGNAQVLHATFPQYVTEEF